MMVYSTAAIEYPQECTNHDEHDKHGSGEPVTEHNDIIPLAIYNFYDATFQVHGMIHNLLLFSFL
jgi:hypothetical protein